MGKILKILGTDREIISAEVATHAIVEMWDSNQFVLEIDTRIAQQAKESDIVLVDYNPTPGFPQPVPKQTIVKILRGKQGKDCWQMFEKYKETRNRKAENREEPAMPGISYSR